MPTMGVTFLLQLRVALKFTSAAGQGKTTMQNHDDGRSVAVQLKVWLECDGSIRIAVPGMSAPFVRVKNDPERPSGHPSLFRLLARTLRERGRPAPEV
jgi:hypothetical protein